MSPLIRRSISLAWLAFAWFVADSPRAEQPTTGASNAEAEVVRLREEVQKLRAKIAALELEIEMLKTPSCIGFGVVTTARKHFAEISIGSDDGLKVGDKLKIVRDGMDSGSAVVRRIDPDRAVVESVEKDDVLQAGDRIITLPRSATNAK